MRCITDEGKEIPVCSGDCPVWRQCRADEVEILNRLPATTAELRAVLQSPEELPVLLQYLEMKFIIRRYRQRWIRCNIERIPPDECPYRALDLS